MKIAYATNQQAADEIIEQYNQFCMSADGDMMILAQGQVILEAVIFQQYNGLPNQKPKDAVTRACIYRYAHDDICNFGDTIDFNVYSEAEFVSLTVFDSTLEAKQYMLEVASEEMMLNLY